MITQDFGQTFTSVFNEFNKVLQKIEQLDLRDNKTLVALNMDDVFYLENDERKEALIFFMDDQLHIEHRESPENSVCFSTKEILQIMKFCLSNGLELPQNEDNGPEKIPSIYETGTCQDCAFWGQVVPGGVWGDCRTDAGNIPLSKLPNKWGGEIQTKYHFTCKSWCQRGYGPGQDGKEYPPSKVDGVSMGVNEDDNESSN